MPPSPAPLRIIVTDDHEWIRRIAAEIVRQTLPDADVVEKEDGLQALEAFQREKCDFLVTNHHMPHMNGMTLIREVRKQVPDLPVLMISIDPDAKSDAMAAGADWFLTKEELMERMPPILLRHAGVTSQRRWSRSDLFPGRRRKPPVVKKVGMPLRGTP